MLLPQATSSLHISSIGFLFNNLGYLITDKGGAVGVHKNRTQLVPSVPPPPPPSTNPLGLAARSTSPLQFQPFRRPPPCRRPRTHQESPSPPSSSTRQSLCKMAGKKPMKGSDETHGVGLGSSLH
uniref:Uncharacterized protein n=1 Tax=Fagus sylvatica TaxID=28930 RepID=A0A2N9GX25_FAGSY